MARKSLKEETSPITTNSLLIRKMRSDALRDDPRAHILLAPPGTNPADYVQVPTGPRGGGPRRGAGGRGRGGGRRGRRGGQGAEARMDID